MQGCNSDVREWLEDGLPTPADERTTLDPSDIGVLYPRLPRNLTGTMSELAACLGKIAPVNWPNGPECFRNKSHALSLRTIHSAKGLQWRAVILLWADLLPISQELGQLRADQSLLYVGMTRAEDVLILTASVGSRFTAEIDQRLANQPRALEWRRRG